VARANKLHKLKIVPNGVRIVAAARRALRQRRWRALVGTVVLNARLASRLTWLDKRRMHPHCGEDDCPSQGSPSLDVAYAVAEAKTAAVNARDAAREVCIPLGPWRKWFSFAVVDGIVSQRNITADNFMAAPLVLAMAEAAVERDGDVAAAVATELVELEQFLAALKVWLVARDVESIEMSEKLVKVLVRLTTKDREKELVESQKELDRLVLTVARLDHEASRAEIMCAFVDRVEMGKENNLYNVVVEHAEVGKLLQGGAEKMKIVWEEKRRLHRRAEARLTFLVDFVTYAGEVERTLSEPLNSARSARLALSAARRRASEVLDAKAARSVAIQRRTSFMNEVQAHVALKAEMAAAARLPPSAVVPASADAARAALKL